MSGSGDKKDIVDDAIGAVPAKKREGETGTSNVNAAKGMDAANAALDEQGGGASTSTTTDKPKDTTTTTTQKEADKPSRDPAGTRDGGRDGDSGGSSRGGGKGNPIGI